MWDEENQRPRELYLATLDAVKCFDNISQVGVLRKALEFGLGGAAVRNLCAFYGGLQRVVTYEGYVDCGRFAQVWACHKAAP